MKKISLALFILFMFVMLFAQQSWEGNAAMSRYGEFPSNGLYGASDSFSRNTVVTVENLENNRKTTVIIVDRLDDPGLFILLSREAAQELGISEDQFVRTRVTLADSRSRLSVNDSDQPYHDDPDINPSAKIKDEELGFLEKYLTADEPLVLDPEAQPTVAGPEEQEPEEPAQEEMLVNEPIVEEKPVATGIDEATPEVLDPIPSITEEPELAEPQPEAEIAEIEPEEPEIPSIPPPFEEPVLMLSELNTAVPDSETVPPRQDVPVIAEAPRAELYVENTNAKPDPDTGDVEIADIPELTEEERRAALIAQQFPLPKPEVSDTLDDIVPEAPILVFETPMVADLDGTPPEDTAAVEFAYADPSVSEPVDEVIPDSEVTVTLEEAEPRPPEPAAEPEETEETVEEPVTPAARPPAVVRAGDIPVVSRLDASSHYLQVGAYHEEFTAMAAAGRFDRRFPVTLQKGEGIYRVLVGPLTPDESGALLVTVKALGYKDAFIKRGY